MKFAICDRGILGAFSQYPETAAPAVAGKWKFIPYVQRAPSRKAWDSPEAALPRWAKDSKPMIVDAANEGEALFFVTRGALRATPLVEPDLAPPGGVLDLRVGWYPIPSAGRVDRACTSVNTHAIGRTDRTTSQGGRALFSTRLRALHALRCAVEREAARKLHEIDQLIAKEEGR